MKRQQVNMIAIILLVVLVSFLCSCGNSEPAQESKPAEPSETKEEAIEEEAESEDSEAVEDAEPAEDETEEAIIEIIDADIQVFNDYFGDPEVSAYYAIKNVSDYYIGVYDASIDYVDKDGHLLSTDQYANCIPEIAAPGEVFYLYSYHHDLKGVDTSNGIDIEPGGELYIAENFVKIELSDVSFSVDDVMDIKIIGRGENTSDKYLSAEPGAVFYDVNNNVVGFCYGLEDFDAGEKKTFEISGDMLSEEYDPSIVDHVEVFIQGNAYD